MPTTFNVLYLGTGPLIDPTEGNNIAENASALVGVTYGTSGSPLYQTRTQATFNDLGGSAGNLDMNNSVSNDTISTNIGAGPQTFTYDGTTTYNVTITYVDGTTAIVTAVIVQTTTGQLFLAPEIGPNADTTAYELRPIQSIRLDSINTNSLTGTGSNRQATGWDDGVVDGTAAADVIDGSYIEPIALGSDRVDNADGLDTDRNDDLIRAGAGNDTITSAAGNDSILAGIGDDRAFGGLGADTILGEDGADSLAGGDGNDSLYGGIGLDTLLGEGGDDRLEGGDGIDQLFGGAGNDTLLGDAGNDIMQGGIGDDSLFGGIGRDSMAGDDGNDNLSGGDDIDTLSGGIGDDTLSGDAGADVLNGGDGTDRLFGGTEADLLNGDGGNDILSGDDGSDTLNGGAGNDQLFGGAGADTLNGDAGNDTITLDGGTDVVSGGADRDVVSMTQTGGVTSTVDGGDTGNDFDVLDLTAWGKDNTVVFRDPGDPENGYVDFFDDFGVFLGRMNFTDIEQVIPCFTPGTMIAAARGLVPVQDLAPGDLILTRDHGMQPLRWIGRRDLTPADLVVRPDLCPVRIAAGALGSGMPARALIVSPQHRVLLASAAADMLFGEHEVLVAARHLVGRPGITQLPARRVSYLHLLFDWHEIVLSDGAWTESFQPACRSLSSMDDGPRDEILSLFPELAGTDSFPAARLTLKAHEARVLLAA